MTPQLRIRARFHAPPRAASLRGIQRERRGRVMGGGDWPSDQAVADGGGGANDRSIRSLHKFLPAVAHAVAVQAL